MANLLQAFRRPAARSVSQLSFNDYIQMVAEASLSGLFPPFSQTIQNDRETIENNYQAIVHSAYKDNGIVFACMLTRRSIFSEARFLFRRREAATGRPGALFADRRLIPLERPFPGGVTSDLLARMIDDADLAGNWFGWRNGNEIVRLRPDWVDILLEPRMVPQSNGETAQVGYRKVGYAYWEDGDRTGQPAAFRLNEIAHFAPYPDPTSPWRGMSWLTPVVRELLADKQATKHKLKFWENGATPNVVVRMPDIGFDEFKKFKRLFEDEHKGVSNAYKTMFLGGGADLTIVGKDMRQVDFKQVQGAGETRIAAAANVHPVIVGLSEGLAGSSLNQGNFNAARRLTADKMVRPLWRNASASLEQIVSNPRSAELWFDEREVAFLREDQKDIAEIQQLQAVAIRSLIDAGFEPDAAVEYIRTDDLGMLVGQHTGLFSVQLHPPGTTPSEGNTIEVTGRDSVMRLVRDGWSIVPVPKRREITSGAA